MAALDDGSERPTKPVINEKNYRNDSDDNEYVDGIPWRDDDIGEEFKPMESKPSIEKPVRRIRNKGPSLHPTPGSTMIDMGKKNYHRRSSSPNASHTKRMQSPGPLRRKPELERDRHYPPRERPRERGSASQPRLRPKRPPDDSPPRRPLRDHGPRAQNERMKQILRRPIGGRMPRPQGITRRGKSESPPKRSVTGMDRVRRISNSPQGRRKLRRPPKGSMDRDRHTEGRVRHSSVDTPDGTSENLKNHDFRTFSIIKGNLNSREILDFDQNNIGNAQPSEHKNSEENIDIALSFERRTPQSYNSSVKNYSLGNKEKVQDNGSNKAISRFEDIDTIMLNQQNEQLRFFEGKRTKKTDRNETEDENNNESTREGLEMSHRASSYKKVKDISIGTKGNRVVDDDNSLNESIDERASVNFDLEFEQFAEKEKVLNKRKGEKN